MENASTPLSPLTLTQVGRPEKQHVEMQLIMYKFFRKKSIYRYDNSYTVVMKISFVSSTGLKQALATVNDYAPLMKDFPLNDLLAATELEKIRSAVQAIFNHLRKIRSTKYPIQRALRLVEAISRDLSSQILKVRIRIIKTVPFSPLWLCSFDFEWSEQVLIVFLTADMFKTYFKLHLQLIGTLLSFKPRN